MSVRVFAPAKINLSLAVGAARADGRHPLHSIVAFADVGDFVEAAPNDTIELCLDGPFAAALAQEPDNLVLRAARALAQAGGVRDRGAVLTLEKHLPIASGLGGGSSDGAAALKALDALWGLGAAREDLLAIARTLGADVPACLAARAGLMTGAGEAFTPIDLPALDAVLVNPLTPVSTAAVYRAFDRMGLGADFAAAPAPHWRDRAAAIAGLVRLGNDLAAPARTLEPRIAQVEALLAGDPRALLVRLSGSGASVFALTQDGASAAALAASVEKRAPRWWTRAARLASA